MKKLIFLLLIVLISGQISSQYCQESKETTYSNRGKVFESLDFNSSILKESIKYSIYLPPDYYSSSRKYPVVYLLHGYSDDETGWIQFGEVNIAADKGIADRSFPPVIIVMPDAKVTWYINDHKNEYPYEDMFIKEFIPYIDKTYKTRTKREFRAVSGLSMGGFGALGYAMRHPDIFSSCAAFSAAIYTEKEFIAQNDRSYNGIYSFLYGKDLKGEERITKHWINTSPIAHAKNFSENELKKVRWYIDCGDDDFLYAGNSTLHIILRDRKIPHEYRVRDGAHSWVYWRTGIIDALKFFGKGFHR
ncbi:alpha/beta hydrolase [Bacteroidota bacterium]